MVSLLGENLKRIRTEKDLTKTKLAELSGVGLSTISQIETGVRQSLRSETIQRLADFIKGVKDILGPKGTLITALALYFGANAAIWYMKGLRLGEGFNDATTVTGNKSFLGKMGDKIKG